MFSAAKSSKAAAGYTVGRSLRFRSSASAYLNRTPASASNRKTWTWSAWTKINALNSNHLFSTYTASTDQDRILFGGGSLLFATSVAGTQYTASTAATYRDPSAWYHIMVCVDTTQATAANRILMYVNGQSATLSGPTYPPQNLNLNINNNIAHWISGFSGGTDYYDGYLAEVNFVDGQQLTPSSFGAYDTNGIWQPVKYTGTYGTNGFYLPFSNTTSTTTLVQDSSGNGNNWTPNNISLTAGTTYDSMLDSPTVSASSSNYAVLNPLNANSGTISDGNLKQLYASASYQTAIGTMSMSSGKWYCEVTCTAIGGTGDGVIGVAGSQPSSTFTGNTSNSYGWYSKGQKYNNGTGVNYNGGATWTTNDVIGIAFDATGGTLEFYKNGTSQGVAYSSISAGDYFVAVSSYSSTTFAVNFGQRPFTYTPPTGFNALCTYNLPTPTIKNGALYNAATLYTGTGSSQAVVNSQSNGGNNPLGKTFYPDFNWIKSRSLAVDHALMNSVVGATFGLSSNNTSAEFNQSANFSSFNSNGFTVQGTSSSYNQSSATYVAWQWNAGSGSSSSNTNGSITSTVSVNATAGFSVVTYTGNAAAATIGHGLGVAPSMVITKPRNFATDWGVYHIGINDPSKALLLNSTAAAAQYGGATGMWNNTAPTSSVFSVGSNNSTGGSYNYVAYCFAAVKGYSAFGSYTGNGSADGPFCYLGFRPRFVLFKDITNAGTNWVIYDTSRDLYNIEQNYLLPNSSGAEGVSALVDFVSNGFKVRASTAINVSSAVYVYAAFAENPFNYSRAR